MIKTICVYCGGSVVLLDEFKVVATKFGKLMAENRFRLVYGGGRYGMMGALATSLIQNKGYGIGIVPKLLIDLETPHPDLQETHFVDSMHSRKMQMAEMADAFVVLPGGFGTLDEFFEIITWRKLKIHEKPIYVLNSGGYWNTLLELIDGIIEKGFAQTDFKDFFFVFDTPEALIDSLKTRNPK